MPPSFTSRRAFLRRSAALGALAALPIPAVGRPRHAAAPVALATWDNRRAVAAGWAVLHGGGHALDAVERGVWIPEADPQDHSVGLGGLPDRDGRVTLDACIMDERHRCGSVAALEGILHPISVARRVMEATPHVMLVGEGALRFALDQGFERTDLLTEEAERRWRAWLDEADYRPPVNVERRDPRPNAPHPDAPRPSEEDHDTIGMLALDGAGRLSGACTTSGLAYKMHGRVGDSPIIGAGLFVDGAAGAATATGHGEEMIRTAAAHTVVEAMRHGRSPQEACRDAVERIRRVTPSDPSAIQAGLLALAPDGRYGGFALQRGFNYVVALPEGAPEPEGAVTHREPVDGGTTYVVEAPSLMR